MSRRSEQTDQLNRIEATLSRLEEAASGLARALGEHGGQLSAVAMAVAELKSLVPATPPPAGTSEATGGGTEGEPAAAARRAQKTPKRM